MGAVDAVSERAIFIGGPDDGTECSIADSQACVGQELSRAEGRAGRVRHYYICNGRQDYEGRWQFEYDEPRELPALKLPETCWFTWRGRRVDVRRFVNADGYPFDCPACGGHFIVEGGGPPNHDSVTVGADGTLTVSPSVRCPSYGCSWHVHILSGVATDT